MNKEEYKFHKDNIEVITKEYLKEVIAYIMLAPITNLAPLGFSGKNYYLYGRFIEHTESEDGNWHRNSIISLRNYCNRPELLITDKNGRFLFYGKYDVNDYEFIVDRFYETIQLLKNKIDTIEKRKEMPKVNFDKANLSVGWDMLKAYYNSKQESKDKEVNE